MDDDQALMESFVETVHYDKTRDWRKMPELGVDPDDDEATEKLTKARRLTPPPFDTPENHAAVERYKHALTTVFGKLRGSVARQVDAALSRKGLAKDIGLGVYRVRVRKDEARDEHGRWTADGGGVLPGHPDYNVTHKLGVNGEHHYEVWKGREWVGEARLSHTGKHVVDLGIKKEHRRQGIAQALYDHIEQHIGHKLEPSPVYQTAEGKRFWEQRGKRAEKVAKADPTDEELLAEAQRIVDGLDLSELQAVVTHTRDIGEEVLGNSGKLAVAEFGFAVSSDIIDQIDERAAEWASMRAAEMVGMRFDANGNLVESLTAEMRIDDATRNLVREIISQGLAEGDRRATIVDALEGVGSYPFSVGRAALIADTEIRRAHSQGALTGYTTARDNYDIRMKKVWLVADEPCPEICEPNGEQGAIPLDEEFQSGDDSPPGHPSCRCAIAPEVEDETALGGASEEM